MLHKCSCMQVMGMPGMVTSVAESLRYITPMAVDVMVFAVLKQLGSPKKKLKAREGEGGGFLVPSGASCCTA